MSEPLTMGRVVFGHGGGGFTVPKQHVETKFWVGILLVPALDCEAQLGEVLKLHQGLPAGVQALQAQQPAADVIQPQHLAASGLCLDAVLVGGLGNDQGFAELIHECFRLVRRIWPEARLGKVWCHKQRQPARPEPSRHQKIKAGPVNLVEEAE